MVGNIVGVTTSISPAPRCFNLAHRYTTDSVISVSKYREKHTSVSRARLMRDCRSFRWHMQNWMPEIPEIRFLKAVYERVGFVSKLINWRIAAWSTDY